MGSFSNPLAGNIGPRASAGQQAPGSTPLAVNPVGTSAQNFNYSALSPSQQQAYSNGVSWDQLGTPGSQYQSAGQASNVGGNPYGNPNTPSYIQSTAVGQGTPSTYLSPNSYAAQQYAYATSPFMTPAALQNEYAVGNAGLPSVLAPNGSLIPENQSTVNINGVQVPYSSMDPMQQAMYGYYNTTNQSLPANFMQQYAGPNAAWNQASLNSIGVPQGSQIANGTIQQLPSALSGLSTTPYGSTPLAQTAAGAPAGTTAASTSSSLSSYLQGLLSQALFGNGNSSNPNSVTTTPLGYTQYTGTPQNTSSTSSDPLMSMIAYMMLNQFMSPSQSSTGGAALGA